MKRLVVDQFIKRAARIHNKYNYSFVNYVNCRTKIKIICKIHGEFEQTPLNHLSGNGCPKCGRELKIKSITKSQILFIKEANSVHVNKYDYSLVDYKNSHEKIIIICKIHGNFLQNPNSHLQGIGCRACGIESRKKLQTKTPNKFIKEAIDIHGDKYDYSKSIYKNSVEKIIIICPKHGEFLQAPIKHLIGRGCSKCGKETCAKSNTKSQNIFIKEAKQIHKNRYDYSEVCYKQSHEKIIIICRKHGKFNQTPQSHLKGVGCPKCIYKNETITGKILEDLVKNIPVNSQLKIGKFRVDFYFEKDGKKYIVEYNGRQHYEPVQFGNITEAQAKEVFKRQIIRDEKLRRLCKENNINLIEIDGREYTGSRIKDYLIEKLLL